MCGRYFVEISLEEIQTIVDEAQKQAAEQPQQLSFFGGEVFPGSVAPVLTANGARLMKWGFPNRIHNKPALINARSETALQLVTFRKSMHSRRCLVPASAYYEWQAVSKSLKQRYQFNLPSGEPFYMAGFYSPSQEFAILTRAAAPEFADIHDRMPVILPRTEHQRWLEQTPEAMDQALLDFTYQAI